MEEQESNRKSGNLKNRLNNYVKYTSIAFQMAAIIFAGVFGGMKIDHWTGTKIPVFTIVLSLISVSAAIYYVVKDFIKFK